MTLLHVSKEGAYTSQTFWLSSLTAKVSRFYWEKSPGHDRQVNKLTNKKRKIFYQAVKKRSFNCLFPKLPSGLYIRKRLMVCYLAPPCADLSFSKECSQGRETHSVLTTQRIRVKHLGDWVGFVSLRFFITTAISECK